MHMYLRIYFLRFDLGYQLNWNRNIPDLNMFIHWKVIAPFVATSLRATLCFIENKVTVSTIHMTVQANVSTIGEQIEIWLTSVGITH